MARLLAEMQRQRDASSGAAQELQQWQRQAGYGAEEVAGLRMRLGALDEERAGLEQALRHEKQRSAELEAVTRQVWNTFSQLVSLVFVVYSYLSLASSLSLPALSYRVRISFTSTLPVLRSRLTSILLLLVISCTISSILWCEMQLRIREAARSSAPQPPSSTTEQAQQRSHRPTFQWRAGLAATAAPRAHGDGASLSLKTSMKQQF